MEKNDSIRRAICLLGCKEMYDNIKILLATKHKKEDAIRKPFSDAFGALIDVPDDYDTDKFGTFSGEVQRTLPPKDVVMKKAQDAMHHYNYDYVIASEGSFGPHPLYYFAPANIELMIFIDRIRNISVLETEISLETNHSHQDINCNDDYSDFLSKIKFGSHGLIIKSVKNDVILAKGVTQKQELELLLKKNFAIYNELRLETDMRAMMNPTRMKVIHRVAEKLVKRLQSICPSCRLPGFGKLTVCGNLKCEICDSKTELYEFKILNCIQCDYVERKERDDGLTKSQPTYCYFCNP
jgi:hypothetical protein